MKMAESTEWNGMRQSGGRIREGKEKREEQNKNGLELAGMERKG
jgi:hypothetical protein